MKHTSGPWTMGEIIPTGIGDDAIRSINGADGLRIATMFTAWRESEANARLIAAAPELLEALKASLTLAVLPDPKEMHRNPEIYKQIEDAIAKATGEEK